VCGSDYDDATMIAGHVLASRIMKWKQLVLHEVVSTWLCERHGRPSLPTNSLNELHMVRFQVIITITKWSGESLILSKIILSAEIRTELCCAWTL